MSRNPLHNLPHLSSIVVTDTWSRFSDLWERFTEVGWIFFAGYLLHYLPFFAIDRTMFLYHYLPALYFKILLLAAMVEHVYFSLK